MSKRRSIDEFEAIFERASIPVLDIVPHRPARVTVVLQGGETDETACALAAVLRSRFADEGCELLARRLADMEAATARKITGGHDIELSGDAFASTAELIGQTSIDRSQLIILASGAGGGGDHVIDVDSLVSGARPPILVVPRPVDDAASVFMNVLHSLSGKFRQTQNFAYPFGLTAPGGHLHMLHVIDENDIADVREALRVSDSVGGADHEKLLREISLQAERYLGAIVAAARDEPFEVDYELVVGDVVASVERVLSGGDYSMLVVGTHREGHSEVSAADYELMHRVTGVPVLAL